MGLAPRLVGLLLVAATAAAVEPVPGLPPMAQLLVDLRSDDQRVRQLAQGWLYLLDDAGLASVQESFDKQGSMREGWEPLQKAQLLAGYKPLLEQRAQMVAQQGGGGEFMRDFTPAELRPLAELVVRKLRDAKTPPMGGGLWEELAARSENVDLLRLAGDRIAQGGMIPGLPAGPFLNANAKLLAGSVEVCQRLLRSVRPGWHEGPPAGFAALLAHRDPGVRDAAQATLAESTAPEALTLALRLLRDADPMTRSKAGAAVISFRPPQADALRALAGEGKADPHQRAMAWRRLAEGDAATVKELRTLLERDSEPLPVSSVAVELLVRRKDGAWLMDRLPRMDPERQGVVLQQLAGSGEDILAPVAKYLDQTEPPQASAVLHALASSRQPNALLVVIERLKDRRPDIVRAAAFALATGTGLRGPEIIEAGTAGEPAPAPAPRRRRGADEPSPPATPAPTAKQRREADRAARAARRQTVASAERAYAVWKAWWDRSQAPLDATATALHAEVQQVLVADPQRDDGAVVGGDEAAVEPLWSLARWAGDSALGLRALRRLARHADPAATGVILALLDDPGLSSRDDEVAAALAARPSDPPSIAALSARLDEDASERMSPAIVVLIAWRNAEHVEALVECALGQGIAFERVRADLVAWNPPALAKAVRRYALAAADDAEVSHRARRAALALLVETATDADVRSLAELAKRPGESREALSALAQLAIGGSEAAQRAFVATLGAKHPAVAEAVAVFAAAAPAYQRDAEAAIEAPDPLMAPLRVLTREPAFAAHAWAALIAWQDTTEPETMRDFAIDNPEAVPQLIAALMRCGPPAVPVAEALLAALTTPEDRRRVIGWMAGVGVDDKRCAALLQDLDELQKKAFAATLGKPCLGLRFIPEPIQAPWTENGVVELAITIENTGKKAVMLAPHASMHLIGDPHNFGVLGMLDLTKSATAGPNKNMVSIAPGRSLKATITLQLLSHFNAAWSSSRFRIETGWHPVGDDRGEQVQRSGWVASSLAPELWLMIDKRHTK